MLGIDVVRRIEAVGATVTQFQPGDELFGSTDHGRFADYVCVPENSVVQKPPSLSFQEAAAVPGAAITVLHALRDSGQIQSG